MLTRGEHEKHIQSMGKWYGLWTIHVAHMLRKIASWVSRAIPIVVDQSSQECDPHGVPPLVTSWDGAEAISWPWFHPIDVPVQQSILCQAYSSDPDLGTRSFSYFIFSKISDHAVAIKHIFFVSQRFGIHQPLRSFGQLDLCQGARSVGAK